MHNAGMALGKLMRVSQFTTWVWCEIFQQVLDGLTWHFHFHSVWRIKINSFHSPDFSSSTDSVIFVNILTDVCVDNYTVFEQTQLLWRCQHENCHWTIFLFTSPLLIKSSVSLGFYPSCNFIWELNRLLFLKTQHVQVQLIYIKTFCSSSHGNYFLKWMPISLWS